tara:strand:- start:69 stop:230 length:162 start_codon:yes stop_codon:yes gene_type:complete
MSYKLLKDSKTGNELNVILRKTDNAYIPKNQNNVDYQEYLEWVKEGNEPDPAD